MSGNNNFNSPSSWPDTTNQNTSTLFNGPFPTSYGMGFNSQNHPNTLNISNPSNQPSSSPSSDFMEELNKDVQIKMLKDRLEFTERLLEDKDKQIENYKQVVI
jgi:hypothetical protein